MSIRNSASAFGLTLGLAGGLFATSASAALITDGGLTLDTAPGVSYQQTFDDPCIIGGPDCSNPADFPLTTSAAGGGGAESSYYSPTYTTAQITGVTGSTAFTVGLDYNDSSVDQILRYFEACYYGAGGASLGCQAFDTDTNLKTVYNGTGFSDFLLSGFELAAGTLTVQFKADWFNNDGRDNYFLIGDDPDLFVPEPGILGLLGLGIVGLAFSARRRRTA